MTMMDRNHRIGLPKEIKEEMGIGHGTVITVEKTDKDTITLRIVRNDDYKKRSTAAHELDKATEDARRRFSEDTPEFLEDIC